MQVTLHNWDAVIISDVMRRFRPMHYPDAVDRLRGPADCCVRALSFSTEIRYAVALAQLSGYAFCDARDGVDVERFNRYLATQGWTLLKSDDFQPYFVWTLVAGLLDSGNYICSLLPARHEIERHALSVCDGYVFDEHLDWLMSPIDWIAIEDSTDAETLKQALADADSPFTDVTNLPGMTPAQNPQGCPL